MRVGRDRHTCREKRVGLADVDEDSTGQRGRRSVHGATGLLDLDDVARASRTGQRTGDDHVVDGVEKLRLLSWLLSTLMWIADDIAGRAADGDVDRADLAPRRAAFDHKTAAANRSSEDE